jgi:hypothetical protein
MLLNLKQHGTPLTYNEDVITGGLTDCRGGLFCTKIKFRVLDIHELKLSIIKQNGHVF